MTDHHTYLKGCLAPNGYCSRWNHGLLFNGVKSRPDYEKMTQTESHIHGQVLYRAHEWGVANFGPHRDPNSEVADRWHRDGAAFYFRDLDDILRFKLVWGECILATASKEEAAHA